MFLQLIVFISARFFSGDDFLNLIYINVNKHMIVTGQFPSIGAIFCCFPSAPPRYFGERVQTVEILSNVPCKIFII